MPPLILTSSLVMTAPPFISAPVPEAVTTAPSGMGAFAGILWRTISRSHRSSSVTAWAATILQQSTTLPPPTARIRSILRSRASLAPSYTLAKVGLDMIPANSVTVLPAACRMPVSSS